MNRYFFQHQSSLYTIHEYADIEAFKRAVLLNRDVAEAQGDEVPSEEELVAIIDKDKPCSIDLNGGNFIISKRDFDDDDEDFHQKVQKIIEDN